MKSVALAQAKSAPLAVLVTCGNYERVWPTKIALFQRVISLEGRLQNILLPNVALLSSASLAEAEADLRWRSNHENYDSVVQTTCCNVI